MREILLIFATLLICNVYGSDDIHSSTEELTTLKFNEENLIRELKSFIVEIESGVEFLKKKLLENEKERELMQKDIKKYVENPLNAILLIKRLSVDIKEIESIFEKKLSTFSTNLENIKISLKEFEGAIEGLDRLQDTYKLKSEDLAIGIIEDKKYRDELSVSDLMAIGKQMIKINEKRGKEFLELAKKKGFSKVELLEEIYQIYKLNEKYNLAVEIIDEILTISPKNERLDGERMHMEMMMLFESKKDVAVNHVNLAEQRNKDLQSTYWTREKEEMILSRACRGKILKSSSELSKLHCRMQSRTPFTKIAPFKIEEANLDPYIIIYHEILSDSEIEMFNSFAVKLNRAEILNPNSTSSVSKRRVAKLKFFSDYPDRRLPALSRRVADMTGLNMATAETWQIQNYGLGGHYVAHHDYTDEGMEFSLGTGNRIATTLFYLTDVEKGGATVFHLLRVYVPPKKGTAVFWWNLSTSGDREVMTRHSGCPVLVGSKIVCNKWIHEYEQERTRPCELERKLPDALYYLKYYNLNDYGIKIVKK